MEKLQHTDLFGKIENNISVETDGDIKVYCGEFWTSKQRQSNSLHEISYRACFKAQLPEFFINLFSKEGDLVYDPFSGRGTTVIQAGLMNRNIISNDINPLSTILAKSRFFIPTTQEIDDRLKNIPLLNKKADIDLGMFFHEETEKEIVSMKEYFKNKEHDFIDDWIQMIATNRLTGHSIGFFSIFTLPPNQAISQERQKIINEKYNTKIEYRDTKKIILKKSKELMRDVNYDLKLRLNKVGSDGLFINEVAENTHQIKNNSVDLIVTSPPFLDVIDYVNDNWMRNWFNNINIDDVNKNISVVKKIEDWEKIMLNVFCEFNRILKNGGIVAFEVGEVKQGKIALDDYVVNIGKKVSFKVCYIFKNIQNFTKTANIWGVKNNAKGTNSNRVIVFKKVNICQF